MRILKEHCPVILTGVRDSGGSMIHYCPVCGLGMVGYGGASTGVTGYDVVREHVKNMHADKWPDLYELQSRSQIEPTKIDADLLMFAIDAGMMDERLREIIENARDRNKLLAARKAVVLEKGSRFIVVNISPKYWEGAEVELTGREGQWLVCKPIRGPHRVMAHFDVKLRDSHVGTITREGM